jgi:hypothetical protein
MGCALQFFAFFFLIIAIGTEITSFTTSYMIESRLNIDDHEGIFSRCFPIRGCKFWSSTMFEKDPSMACYFFLFLLQNKLKRDFYACSKNGCKALLFFHLYHFLHWQLSHLIAWLHLYQDVVRAIWTYSTEFLWFSMVIYTQKNMVGQIWKRFFFSEFDKYYVPLFTQYFTYSSRFTVWHCYNLYDFERQRCHIQW